MKKVLTLILFLCCTVTYSQQRKDQNNTPEWKDPGTTSVNRLPMKSNFFAFESRTLAESRDREQSAYFLSLNGIWKFRWVEK
ncbi:MAG: hypothetical protein LBE04_02990, partial [Prevotellaceae bacterium]|nr:hypothetical protein [Prevotellaceae bacterium]